MTVLNITVAADRSFAVMSCDSFAGELGNVPLAIAEEAPTIGPARPGTATPSVAMSKIIAVPHLRMLVSGIGAAVPLLTVYSGLLATYVDVQGIKAARPHINANVPKIAKANRGEFMLAAVGWVEHHGAAALVEPSHVRAYAWASSENFAERDIGGANTVHPAPDTAAADYPALADAWEAALLGDDPEGFHRHLVRHQLAAARAGKYGDGAIVGGTVTIARLDARGILLQTIAP